MVKTILSWLFGRKARKVPLVVYPARRRGMLSCVEIPKGDEEYFSPWGSFAPGMESGEGGVFPSGVNLGREIGPKVEREDGEDLRRKLVEREDFAEEWDKGEFKNPYG